MKQCCMRLDESAPVDESDGDRNSCHCAGLDLSGNGLSFVSGYAVHAVTHGARNAHEQRLCLGWDKLSLSLPVSRRDVVSSKFVISLLVNLTVVALGMICIAGMNAFGGDAMGEDMMGMLACEAVGLALMGIEFVLVLRFGPDRGRYLLLAVVWVRSSC